MRERYFKGAEGCEPQAWGTEKKSDLEPVVGQALIDGRIDGHGSGDGEDRVVPKVGQQPD
jgi:hypothetical protein